MKRPAIAVIASATPIAIQGKVRALCPSLWIAPLLARPEGRASVDALWLPQ